MFCVVCVRLLRQQLKPFAFSKTQQGKYCIVAQLDAPCGQHLIFSKAAKWKWQWVQQMFRAELSESQFEDKN